MHLLDFFELLIPALSLSPVIFKDTNDITDSPEPSGSRNDLQSVIRGGHHTKTPLHIFLLPLHA